MQPINCTCGNKGCTTKIFIRENTQTIDLVIEHKEKDSKEAEYTIALNPNEIVRLVRELKQSLENIC